MDLRNIYNNLRRRNGNLSEDELRRRAWMERDRIMFESLANAASSAAAGAGGGGGRRQQSDVTPSLTITFENIEDTNHLFSDYNLLEDWNYLFQLPGENGEAYTELIVEGNTITLKGGSNVTIRDVFFGESSVSITSIVDTGTVIGIGDGVFYYTPLTNVNMTHLKTLGEEVFYGCYNLTEVNLPELENINGSYAFYDTGISEANFPKLLTIVDYTFYNCDNLITVNLPLLTSMGDSTFRNAIQNVNLPSLVTMGIDSFRNCSGLSTISLPLVTSLPNRTFYGTGLTEANNEMFPNVTTIGSECFRNAPLATIDLQSVTTLDDGAFSYCSLLTSVNLPSLTDIPNNCFTFCSSLPEITLSSFPMVSSIGTAAFQNCNSLELFELAEAFGNTIPNSVFNGCSSLDFSTIDLTQIEIIGTSAFANTPIDTVNEVYFPMVTTIGSGAFLNCDSITSVSLPLITHLPDACFSQCSNLLSIDTNSFPLVTTIDNFPFSQCSSLETFELNNVITASGYLLSGNTSLTSVSLNSLETIGEYSFEGDTLLTSINLPSLLSVGNGLFKNCTGLTEILLPECTTLGNDASDNQVFLNISGNTIDLTIPAALMSIDNDSPDGDIVYLQSNNTVNVTQV